MPRSWVNDAPPYMNADNLNALEAELATALWSEAAVATKTSDYTATATDKVLVFNGSNLTATLPDPATVNKRLYKIKNIHSSALVVTSAGTSKTLDGAAYRVVQPYQTVEMFSDGTQWLLLTNGVAGVTPTVRAFSTNYVSANNIAVTVPATAVAEDLLVVFLGSNYASSTAPAGWSLVGMTSASFHNGALFTKKCITSDIGSTLTFTLTGAEPVNAVCLAVQGASNVPVGSNVTQSTSTSSSYSSATASGQNKDLALIFGSQRVGSQTINSTLGTAVTRRTADASLSSAAFSYPLTAGGSVTPTLSTSSTGAGWSEGIIILRGV